MLRFEFKPPIKEGMKTPDFRAHMVETAWDYYMTAHSNESIKSYIKTALSCLSIEILLKSFNAEVSRHPGKINEKYTPNKNIKNYSKAHDLVYLFNLLDPDYKEYLFDCRNDDHGCISSLGQHNKKILDTYRKSFITYRYSYEPGVRKVCHEVNCKKRCDEVNGEKICYEDKLHHHDISRLAALIICKMVYLYKNRGCTDYFILSFDESSFFFNHVQRFLLR